MNLVSNDINDIKDFSKIYKNSCNNQLKINETNDVTNLDFQVTLLTFCEPWIANMSALSRLLSFNPM